MSQESLNWLNNNVLIGFADKYPRAWHFDPSSQGDEPNHYPLAIPVADVNRRLFHWYAEEITPSYPTDDGYREMPGKAIVRSDNGAFLGYHGDNYTIHQYPEWLIHNVSNLLDASSNELGIGSAGLLKGGAIAWVQLEAPESIKVGDDMVRPFITAVTSHNGRYATSYSRGMTRVVCDNTLASFMSAKSSSHFRVRHTKHSALSISAARDALSIAFQQNQEDINEIDRLMNTTVTTAQFMKVLDLAFPIKLDAAPIAVTKAANAKDRINTLYVGDSRVAPYKGTAWGVHQAFNTDAQWNGRLKGNRFEAVAEKFLSGKTLDETKEVTKLLEIVLA